jgi:YD repeat-containing protein
MRSLPHFFLFFAIALGLFALPHQAKAVIALRWQCSSSWDRWDPSTGTLTHGGCEWVWYDDGGGGGGNGSVGAGGGGGGSPHTSSNTQSTVNQNNSKNPKSPCDKDKPTASVTTAGDPIDTSSGSKIEKITDFAEPGEMGLTFERYYNSRYSCVGTSSPCTTSMGTWTTNLDYKLDVICYYESTGGNPDRPIRCGPVTFTRPDGSSLSFVSTTAFFGTIDGEPNPGPFYPVGTATLTNNGDGTYTLRDENAQALSFDSQGNLLSIKDPSGIGWTLTHPDGNTTIVTHTNGMSYKVALVAGSSGTYGSAKQINVTDPAGGVYVYQSTVGVWDSFTNPVSQLGVISSETLPGSPGTTVSYKYLPDNTVTGSYGQLTEVDYNGVAHDVTTYDSAGRANSSSLADGTEKTTIVYSANSTGPTVTVTNPLGRVTVYQYDGNQLLLSVTGNIALHCDGSFAQNTYDANGNLATSADNNGNTTQYVYAATGLLQQKVEAVGTAVQRTTDFTWDSTAGTVRPLSIKVEGLSETDFTYDGNNRLASQALKNLTGVGTAQQALTNTYAYTYNANGTIHSRSVTHPSPSGSNTDVYTYDALGNLATVANGLGQTTTYSNYNGLGEVGHVVGPNGDVTDYAYDARGRVQTKTTYPNGVAATWTYSYDGFGLPASELTPAGGTTTWNRDAEMRVTSIVRNDKDGTSTESFGYDANSDITSHTVSRNGATSLSETLIYDALGRVYQRLGMHNQKLTYGYDGNGNVVSVTDAASHSVSIQYDALNRPTRKTSSGGASPLLPSAAPTLSAPANSSNGSYSVSWSAISDATTYTLQKQLNGGSWSTVQTGGATSFALSSQGSGTYGYRVVACNVTGCSSWSSTATVYVTQVIGNIDVVFIDGSGNASITGWACSTGLAQSINADLYLGGPYGTGTFIGRYTANQSSEPAVASACNVSSGSYRFSIPLSTTVRSQYVGQTIYLHGLSPIGAANPLLTNSGSFTVPVNEPAGAPTLSVPSTNGTGSYTVSWSAVTGATSYTLQEQVNGGAWATVQGSAATSWAASGKGNGSYGYHVQACNSSGCNAWSNVATVTVLLPPVAPASISAPASSSGVFTVTWAASTTATSYTLQQSANGGGWTTVYSNAANGTTLNEAATGSYTLRVQACNSGGCSGYTTSNPVAVTIPPASAPSLSVPASSSNGSYTVSWTGVSGATSYTLQEQINGGGWSTVQANGNTSWGTSGRGNGTYGYQVQACNVGGCGPWSGTGSVSVLLIPTTPTGLSSTLYATYYSDTRPPKTVYTLTGSWSGVAGASNYNFHYCQQSGSCYTTNTTATSIPEFQVQGATVSVTVQACNANGCSAWSASVTPTTVNQ